MLRATSLPHSPGPAAVAFGARRANVAAIIGSALEFYDFTVYSLAATLVFGPLFFPGSDPLVGTIQSLATYAVGFLFRPIGGIIFGRLGDRIGRKRILILTLVLMGSATTLVGLLPTYNQIGVAAPILLVVLRIVQGLGASAEFGSATIVAVEFADDRRRGSAGALPGMGIWGGNLTANIVLTLAVLLPDHQFLTWGWRIPFLVSFVLFIFGLWLRSGLPETPVFEELRQEGRRERSPLLRLLRTNVKAVLCVAAAAYGTAAVSFFYQAFALSYAHRELGLDTDTVLIGTLAGAATALVVTPVFGRLSDRIGRMPVLVGGFAFSAVFAFVFFPMTGHGHAWTYWVAMVLAIGVGNGAIFAAGGTFFAELFPAELRSSGFGLSREFANALGAALTPLIAIWIESASGGSTIWLAVFAAGTAVLALIGVIVAGETYRSPIGAQGGSDDSRAPEPV
ncbi:MFS transporter [Nocardia miyunensis]|uniref:MFS transporter n=1 Tax=Nocardia miyunensis TaxID=282684 RepID=UPI00082BC656|nr:MFS transporter [Nocardia miyunensis]